MGQCCIENLAQLDPPPNIVVISQDKPDHCHERSLKQLDAGLKDTTIYAQAGAAKRIRSWKYFPSQKVIPFSTYTNGDSETNLVRFSIPAQEDLHKYPGVIPGELTMAFLAPKFDLAGVHSGVGFTYRPPMFVDSDTGSSPLLLPLVPVRTSQSTAHSRSNSTLSKTNATGMTDFAFDFDIKETASVTDGFNFSLPSPRVRKPELLPQLDTSRYPSIRDSMPTPPDSPTRSMTTIDTRTTATEYSALEVPKYEAPLIQLAPEWLLPPVPTLSQKDTRSKKTLPSTTSSLYRLKSALSTPNLHDLPRPRTPKKKKSLNLRLHKHSQSADQPLTITTPHSYTTDPTAPPLPNTPLSPFYPLTPTTSLPTTHRPKTPFSPTSTIAGPKTISILYVPHGISYSALQPWATSHLVSTAALPLTLLLHPFDSVRNLWFLGGHVIQGGQQGAEIAKALMAKQWISTHDGAKEEGGWLVKKVVKRVFSRDEVSRILEDGDRGWDYRRTLDNQKPRTGVEVLKVGQEIAISA